MRGSTVYTTSTADIITNHTVGRQRELGDDAGSTVIHTLLVRVLGYMVYSTLGKLHVHVYTCSCRGREDRYPDPKHHTYIVNSTNT